ncbi:tRNA lysidine(34) synthetase TilS [Planktotalea sp.]|uniref:tRNA lysidine(34) synthetase TilS n=1 Tax=Planktotalea sp. TaxID=2029877 RepID=UPI003D6AF836
MLNTQLLADHLPLGIALSGGSDSTALLSLAVEALGAPQVRAATVNHGLRREAAQEAQIAKQLCTSLGVHHDTLELSLDDGADLQARARHARYGALAGWAIENNLGAVALGHTKDDVAETFLMRLARGSGVDGLAKMPELFRRDGMCFARPLLKVSRQELQDHLRVCDLSWSEDPSNIDPRFTRVKMRQAQSTLETLGLTQDRLAQTADWMRAASEVLEQAADTWIINNAWSEHGDAVFNLSALQNAPEETAYRALSRALCNISSNPYRPRLTALKQVLARETATTLHGCLVYRAKNTLRVTQELRAAQIGPSRWIVKGPIAANASLAPLGTQGLSQLPDWRETAVLPRRSLLASPAIWDKNRLVAAPLAKPDDIWQVRTTNPLHFSK